MWRARRNNRIGLAVVGGLATVLLLPPLSARAVSSTIQADICSNNFIAPVITSPADGTQTEEVAVIVSGTGEPSMTVSIRDNSTPVAATLVAGDGTFSVQVPLAVGDNALVAREQDDCENIRDSLTVNVERLQKPAPPDTGGGTTPVPSLPQTPGVPGNGKRQAGGAGELPASGPVSDSPLNRTTIPDNREGSARDSRHPIITSVSPGQVFNSQTVWLGGKAAPGSVVVIYLNGKEVARVRAAIDGTFGARITLQKGTNTVQVSSELNGASAWSDEMQVQYKPIHDGVFDWWWLWIVILLAIIAIMLIWLVHRRRRQRKEETA